jgi:hypothetical protein
MRGTKHLGCMETMTNMYKILAGKPDRKRPLKRPRHGWEDNIKMDLKEIEWEGVG